MTEWPDIPGVTSFDGQPRLPRDPRVSALFFAHALDGSHEGRSPAEIIERVLSACRAERVRLEGLAGWLPVSRVAHWSSGVIVADPHTDLVDLSVRFAAWFSTQPVLSAFADQSRAYARTVVDEARRLRTESPLRTAPPRHPSSTAMPSLPQDEITDVPGPLPASIRSKLLSLLEVLDASFLERGQHLRASLLALLSGQHVLLLGPPGTAKSMLARSLCECFADATYFEYLLSRFTHPDELFGPVSIPGLKAEDYRRLTEGFLPRAEVAFLDEIFKANSAILNSLLTLINERVFHHGRHRDPVPLIGLLGASNELPDPEGGLGALYDRFLVRLVVPPIAEAPAFLQVATGSVPTPVIPDDLRLTLHDLAEIRAAAARVRVPPVVTDALVKLWKVAEDLEWECSDRRWRQAVRFLKVAAVTDGRREVLPLDLLLLQSVLPPTPDRGIEVREALLEQLGGRALPSHDLRAQWMLLSMDRVAPSPSHALTPVPSPQAPWNRRLPIRRENLARFLELHELAVRRLATHRAGVEGIADAHLWIAKLPTQVLANHIERARELAKILSLAEQYRRALSSPEAAARTLIHALPKVNRRIYGYGAVCVLSVADVQTGLTTSGDREPLNNPSAPSADGLVRPTSDPLYEVPMLTLTAPQWLDFIEGRLEISAVLATIRVTATTNVKQALLGVRRHLQNNPIPAPPPLPDL